MSEKDKIDAFTLTCAEWPNTAIIVNSNIKIKPTTTLSELEDIEIIFNPKATILTDKRLKRKAVVKKCSLDEDDKEKAFLYAFAKLHGITPKMVERALKGAIVQVGEKHEKKTKKTEEIISNNI